MSRLRVLMTGTFDVRNYGDLLFPLIAAQRLQPYGIDVAAVSPTGRAVGWPDAAASISTAAALSAEQVAADAVMIGGGYIIHSLKARFVPEYKAAGRAEDAYAGLWLGATAAARRRAVPLVWNAPGVLMPFPDAVLRRVVHPALEQAAYLAVRDVTSAGFLAFPGVRIVPDTVAGIAALWPRASLASHFRTLLARKGLSDARFMAVHLRGRPEAGGERMAVLAERIDRFANEHGLTPLLPALGESLGDAELLRQLSQRLRRPHLLLDDPLGLRELAAALAYASLYVGASLHGYVTSAAYGVPGVIVAPTMVRKFAGFLQHTGRAQDLAPDWPGALARAAIGRPADAGLLPPSVLAALDEHWAAMAAAIIRGQRRAAAAETSDAAQMASNTPDRSP